MNFDPDDLEPLISRSSKFDIKYFENGDRYDDVVNGIRYRLASYPLTLVDLVPSYI